MIYLSDGILEVAFDSDCGSLRSVTDKLSDIVIAEGGGVPFILEYEQDCFSSDFSKFAHEITNENILRLTWEIEGGVTLRATAMLENGSLSFRAHADNGSGRPLCSAEYPIVDGIRNLSDNDYLAHSYATGFLVHNPLDNFAEEGSGLRHMPYPESFSGASMQFFTYYAQGLTGLLFAAYDGAFRQKWLNFYNHGGKLRASQIFGYEDIGAGKPLTADWDFTITLTKGDGWYEAAEIYRDWALQQQWCAKGKMHERSEKCEWLLEQTGAATFGINACHDRTKWLRQYSADIQSPIFHILGPDWTKVDQNYVGSLPGGYDDWFPTKFDKANMQQIKAAGDKVAPFEFDFLLATNKSDSDKIKDSLQVWPKPPKSHDAYTFSMLCPICGYTKDLHVERDRRVISEGGCDAMYYDISANNIIKTCMSESHGHEVGAGAKMTHAYRDIYAATQKALCDDSGKYIPLGTEMINETLIDRLDYYQARANAQPCSTLETWAFRKLVRSGEAQLIPMFMYVYSGYAPVRLDGWGKLTEETGDIIYHTIAKTYLWGGIFEINCEYSPMEALDGEENPASEHYCDYKPRGYSYDKRIADYIRKFAELRTGSFNKYLAYGQMQRPPKVECRKIIRTWLQYNHGEKCMEQNQRGIIALDSVIASAYTFEGKTALFIANTTAFPEQASISYDMPENISNKLNNITLEPYQLMAITF